MINAPVPVDTLLGVAISQEFENWPDHAGPRSCSEEKRRLLWQHC